MSEMAPSFVPSQKAGPLMLNETKALWAMQEYATCAREAASQRGCFHLLCIRGGVASAVEITEGP